jgi:hypothetical protein
MEKEETLMRPSPVDMAKKPREGLKAVRISLMCVEAMAEELEVKKKLQCD